MSNKVVEVNLEQGYPTVDSAITTMKSSLTRYKAQGYKAVILIHGYGSTGVGGGIKTAVSKNLSGNGLRGIVRVYVSGEQWFARKREALDVCQSLKPYERKISGNRGITVVVLR